MAVVQYYKRDAAEIDETIKSSNAFSDASVYNGYNINITYGIEEQECIQNVVLDTYTKLSNSIGEKDIYRLFRGNPWKAPLKVVGPAKKAREDRIISCETEIEKFEETSTIDEDGTINYKLISSQIIGAKNWAGRIELEDNAFKCSFRIDMSDNNNETRSQLKHSNIADYDNSEIHAENNNKIEEKFIDVQLTQEDVSIGGNSENNDEIEEMFTDIQLSQEDIAPVEFDTDQDHMGDDIQTINTTEDVTLTSYVVTVYTKYTGNPDEEKITKYMINLNRFDDAYEMHLKDDYINKINNNHALYGPRKIHGSTPIKLPDDSLAYDYCHFGGDKDHFGLVDDNLPITLDSTEYFISM